MLTKRFTKTTENFTCLNCQTLVHGNGYTNHCPHCLYSLHVDNHPGDRSHLCHGLMTPIDIIITAKQTTLIHRCQKCGHQKSNKTSDQDNFEALIKLTITHKTN